jgi:hypothetical protein
MKRLFKKLRALFKGARSRADKATAVRKEDAFMAVKQLVVEHNLPCIVFESDETCDRFLKAMRQGYTITRNMEAQGIPLPPDLLI